MIIKLIYSMFACSATPRPSKQLLLVVGFEIAVLDDLILALMALAVLGEWGRHGKKWVRY